MDAEIGRFLGFLRQERLWEETLFVLTSDHGEEFFEHGGVLHGQTQYQEVIRVPLLIKGPGIPADTRVASPVSLVDIVPTLAARAGLEAPPGIDGIDLSPLLEGLPEKTLDDRYLFSEADHNNVEHDITRSVRYRTFKLHFNRLSREYRLYDLSRDPAELEDVAPGEKDALAALTGRLDRFLASEKVEAPMRTLSEEEIEKLRSLGYLR
jgi:arylsulfatase A-like enzyme